MRHLYVSAIAVAFFIVAGMCTSQTTHGQAFVNGSFEADNWLNGANPKPDVDGVNGPITG